jgi:TIR domain-containing protein
MPKIAISYRRQDSEAVAGRIRDRLVTHYGDDSVFMDIDSIPFGTDFRDHIKQVLGQTDIVLAIIGPHWAGTRRNRPARIQEPNDPVRIEVERALEHGVPLVPVLVNGAQIPKPSELPESLQDLSYRNAAEVDSGRDFHPHVDRLIRSMDQMLGQRASPAAAPAADASPGAVQPPEPAPTPAAVAAAPAAAQVAAAEQAAAQMPARKHGARLPLWPMLAAAVVVAATVLGGIYFYLRPAADNRTVAAPTTDVPAVPPKQAAAPAAFDTSCKHDPAAAFYDNFTSPDGGWGQPSEAKYFKDGRMVLHPAVNAVEPWIYLPVLFKESVTVCSEVIAPQEVRSAAGDAAGGVIFWATDYSTYYVAEIYTNGTFSVWRRLLGKWIPVVPRRPSAALREGPGAVNQLQVTTGSRQANLLINGREAAVFWGQPPGRGGAVGLFGQSEEKADNAWRFAGISVVDHNGAAPEVAPASAAFVNSCEANAAAAFVDEFANPDPGWGAPTETRFFKDGEMVLQPDKNAGVTWLYLPLVLERGVVCADIKSPAAIKDSAGESKGGVIFWASDLKNYYVAQFYVDGSYAIYRKIDGRWVDVLPRTKATSIHAGADAVNRVKVAFDGHGAGLTINGSLVARLQHGQPPPGGGSFGLYAESEVEKQNQWHVQRIAAVEDDHPLPAAPAGAAIRVAAACRSGATPAFADDFAAPDPGWGKSGDTYRFADGQMVLHPKANTNVSWIYMPMVFSGATVCAEFKFPAVLKNAADVACAGVIFWARDYQNYYLAVIFTDGTYTVRRKIAGKWYVVAPRTRSDSIRTGPEAVNDLAVSTAGSRATLQVNNKEVVGFWGQMPSRGGSVGLYGQSETKQDDDWRFLGIAVVDHEKAEPVYPAAASDAAKACKPAGSLAFFDDFTAPDPGWGTPGAGYFFRNGRMVLKAKPAKIEAWIYPGLIFTAAAICGDIVFPEETGPPTNAAAGGIIFWAADYKNYHVTELYPDGTYSIWRKIDDEWAIVIPRSPAAAIRRGPGAINRMKVVFDHSEVSIVVNDTTVISFHGQPRENGGSFGLYGASASGMENEWQFGNLVVVDLAASPAS